MKKSVWLLLAVVVGGYLLSTSVVAVKETEYAIISQFGRPVNVVTEAGAAFKLPDPIQTVQTIEKRLQLLSLPSTEYSTNDQRNLVVDTFVVWKITDPSAYLSSVRTLATAEQRLETLVNSEVGAAIGRLALDDIFAVDRPANALAATFNEVAQSASALSKQELGIDIISVRPNRLGFPKQNLLAIYKRMESEWDKLAKQYRAEGQEEAASIRAETDLEVRNLQAKAYRDAQTIKGNSEAAAQQLYADAFNSNPEYYQFTQSLEAYEAILNSDDQLILSTETPLFERLLNPPQSQSGLAE